MNDDWNDLARLWQADAAGVSLEDIDAHLRREKRQMAGVAAAEIAGLAVGLGAAALLLLLTPHLWLGVVIVAFGGVSAGISLRLRRASPSPGSRDLLHSLKDSLDREDWIAEQLRLGRVLSFVALFALVMVTAVQLLRLKTFDAAGLIFAGVGAALVMCALGWNLWLTVRARRRRDRLAYLEQRLKA